MYIISLQNVVACFDSFGDPSTHSAEWAVDVHPKSPGLRGSLLQVLSSKYATEFGSDISYE